MKSERCLSLIQERMAQLFLPSRKKSFFARRKPPQRVSITIQATKDDIFRADVLLDDLRHISRDYVIPFTLDGLISLLYIQFIERIIEGDVEVEPGVFRPIDLLELSRAVMSGYEQYVLGKPSDAELQAVSPNRYILKPVTQPTTRRRMYEIEIVLDRSAAFRGEVALRDMHRLNPAMQLNLPQLISLLFAQFMAAIRTGNQRDVLEELIESAVRYFGE